MTRSSIYILTLIALVLTSLHARTDAALDSAEVTACLSIADAVPELKTWITGEWTQVNIESCNAIGMTCDASGTHVVELDFSSVTAEGTVPAAISALTSLTRFTAKLVLTGTLPASWSSLTALTELVLDSSSLTGPIPSAWSTMTVLNTLNLNFETSTAHALPSWLGRVNAITIGNAKLTEFPTFMSTTTNTVGFLYLNNVDMAGSFPAALWSSTSLSELYISTAGVDFSSGDTLPDLSGMTSLSLLTLAGNGLAGSLPSGWPSNLQRFTLSTMPYLTGSLPQSLMDLPLLNTIYVSDMGGMSGNLLGATDPATAALATFTLRNTNLDGSITANFMNALSLRTIDIQANGYLTGPLPELSSSGVTNLNLREIKITDNALIGGSIPATWAQLPSLTVLFLDSNGLVGTIPQSYAEFESSTFSTLSLAFNSLSGAMPNITFNGAMPLLYLTNCGLTGTIPASLSQSTDYGRLYLAGNNFNLCANAGTAEQAQLTATFQGASLCQLTATAGRSDCDCLGTWPAACFTGSCTPIAPPAVPSTPTVSPMEPSSAPTDSPASGPTSTPLPPAVTPSPPTSIPAAIPSFVPTGAASSTSFGFALFIVAFLAVFYAL